MTNRSPVMQKLRDFTVFKIGFPFVRAVERAFARFSLVGDDARLDRAKFVWSGDLEENWRAIRKELDEILPYQDHLPGLHDIDSDPLSGATGNKWKTYFLYAFGYKSDSNCRRCPETTRLIEEIPGMQTALFSVLSPGTHIQKHRGAYKGLIRCHLGLLVPERSEDCWMQLGDGVLQWEEGKLEIFDDTRHHEVWNDTDQVRVVLMFDIERPFPFPISTLNSAIIRLMGWSSYVRDGRQRLARSEKRFEKAVKGSRGGPGPVRSARQARTN